MLKDDEILSIQLAFENYSYICGSPILPEEHPLYNILYVKINQTCHDHIEQVYYSCKVQHLSICYYCEEDELVETDEKSKEKKTIVVSIYINKKKKEKYNKML